MNEDKNPFDQNFLFAVVLCLLFFLGWSWWMNKRYAPAPDAASAMISKAVTSVVPTASPQPAPEPFPAPTKPGAGKPSTWSWSNEDLRVTLDTSRGIVTSWWVDDSGEWVDLVQEAGASRWLAAVPDAVFSVVETREGRIRLRARLSNGVVAEKYLDLTARPFPRMELTWSNPTGAPVTLKDTGLELGPGLGTSASEKKENAANIRAILVSREETLPLKDGQESKGPFRWFGIDNRFFLFALMPSAESSIFRLAGSGKKENMSLRADIPNQLQPGEKVRWAFDVYAGHKGFHYLKGFKRGLEASVDFGFFRTIGRWIFNTLTYFHGMTGNYGWAIILLTMVIQVLTFPLTYKSFKASAAMQNLQPQMKLLQESYKDNPKQLNVEMMKLYRREGVNPLSGCLPMVLQIPIFFALFTTIRNAYELRNAPFIFWIKDLSAHDPYFILPIVMGGSMFVQQKMTTMSVDPAQRQMMLILPVVFTFMFLKFPSGLVLYWLVNNLMSIGMQVVIKRRQAAAHAVH